jgi:hypothetical protein
MKLYKSVTALACITSLAFSGFSYATFVDAGNGMVYDTLLDVTWLQDANYAATQYVASGGVEGDADGLMTWDDAALWTAGLSVGGVSGWRLPTINPTGSPRPNETGESPHSGNESGWLWYQLGPGGAYIGPSTDISPFINLPLQGGGSEWYWTSNEPDPTHATRISMNCACWDSPSKTNEYYAWAVHSGNVTGVPEPATFLLLLTGLAGLGFARSKKKQP